MAILKDKLGMSGRSYAALFKKEKILKKLNSMEKT